MHRTLLFLAVATVVAFDVHADGLGVDEPAVMVYIAIPLDSASRASDGPVLGLRADAVARDAGGVFEHDNLADLRLHGDGSVSLWVDGEPVGDLGTLDFASVSR